MSQARWRPAMGRDLRAIGRIAGLVHRDFPEGDAVFAERLALCPPGCLVLEGEGRAALGYAISHPWCLGRPPPLDSLLGALPAEPECWYLHDIALMPEARGAGASRTLVERLEGLATAAGLGCLSLVAVGGTEGLWTRHGFVTQHDPWLVAKLASYGGTARFMVRRSGQGRPTQAV